MNNSTKLTALLAFFLAFMELSSLNAQAKIPFTPSTSNQVMQHIDFRYGNIIQTNLFDIYTDLSTQLLSDYNDQIPLPQANIHYITSNTISFRWPNIPNLDHIEVLYFNLNTGQATSIGNVQVDSVVLNLTTRDPYLFAFQGVDAEGMRGGMTLMLADHSFDFIIVDKDVLRSDIPPSYMDCGCNISTPSQYNARREFFNTIFIPFANNCESTKYSLDIETITPIGQSHYVRLDFVDNQQSFNTQRVHTLNYCSFPNFDTPYDLGIPDRCETIVTNEGITLYFDKDEVIEVNLQASICKCEGLSKSIKKKEFTNAQPTALQIKSFPNPADQYANISYAIPQDGAVNIVLYNIVSQEAQYLKREVLHQKGMYNFSIPMDQLPAGIYNCVLEFNGKATTTRIVKTKL